MEFHAGTARAIPRGHARGALVPLITCMAKTSERRLSGPRTCADLQKRERLQTVSQQRRSHCVQRWLVGARAIEAQQTLATLLKGRDPSGSRPFALHEYARVSLSVHEAQLLVEHLTLADRTLLDKVAASTRGGIADRLARRAWMSQRLGVAQAVA